MIEIDEKSALIRKEGQEIPLGSSEGFKIISDLYIRSGWDTKYVYSFSWLGRPIIQLPDDMIRIQEVIYSLQPDVIVETGIAHGGSLVFYAGICKLIGKGRVIGIDIDIREHNKKALDDHFLKPLITTIEGSAIDTSTFNKVKSLIKPEETVLVLLDSCHTYEHVLAELELYSQLVTQNSYIVATDGVMEYVVGAPRTQPDWTTNNPKKAAEDFVASHPDFEFEEPIFPFNEGDITERVTYWPSAYIKRIQ